MPISPYQSPFSQYFQPRIRGNLGYQNPVMNSPKPANYSWNNPSQNGQSLNSTPWDPMKMFQPPTSGSTYQAAPTQTMTMRGSSAPAADPVWDPAPANNQANWSMASNPAPLEEPFVPNQSPAYNISMGQGPGSTSPTPAADPVSSSPAVPQTGGQSPNFNFNMDDLLKYMGNTAMPTMDQIQMDPSYQFQQQQGINAIDSSAAAKGGLLSSGHTKDILDYSQGLASQEYGKAFDRYTQNQNFKAGRLSDAYGMLNNDRAFGANRYDTGFNQDQQIANGNRQDYQYANNFANGVFNNQSSNWNSLLQNAFGNQSSLANFGQNATNGAVDVTTGLASTLANLGMSQAQIQAMTTMGASGANRTTAGSLASILGMIFGGG